MRWAGRATTAAALAPCALFLIVTFLAPALILLRISTYEHEAGALMRPGFTLRHYAAFLGDPFYLGKLWLTARIAVIVTVLTLLLAVPVAYLLARARFVGKGLLIGLLLSPLLTNFVVLVFAWIVLLGDNGAVNRLLVGLGLPQPLKLLYAEPGVVISLVHVSLPYALIPLIAAIAQIRPEIEQAAMSLGASPWRTLAFVVLPMAGPGIAASAFVTVSIVLSGFAFALFVGGDAVLIVPLLIWQQVTKTLNWPLAAAMSIASLAITLIVLWAAMRAADLLQRRRFAS